MTHHMHQRRRAAKLATAEQARATYAAELAADPFARVTSIAALERRYAAFFATREVQTLPYAFWSPTTKRQVARINQLYRAHQTRLTRAA